MPISGLQGQNLVKKQVHKDYPEINTLLDTIDGLETIHRSDNRPLRITITNFY